MLYPDETTLRDGYYIRPIGNRFVVFNAGGFAIGRGCRCASIAVRRLIDLRIEHTARQKQMAQNQQQTGRHKETQHAK